MGGHNEGNGNVIQLLKLQGRTDPRQNECIHIMALSVLRQISRSLSNGVHFCIIANEITDSSNREQLVVCLRWVDDAQEDFWGYIKCQTLPPTLIVKCLREVLIWMNLNINNCRGQCYDGASNMKGHKKGVATQKKGELFTRTVMATRRTLPRQVKYQNF